MRSRVVLAVVVGCLVLASGARASTFATGMTLTPADTVAITVDDINPDRGYDVRHVTGAVELGGAALSVTLHISPAGGQYLTLVDNDGTDPVIGTFAGLPEGAILSVSGKDLQITYRGGDGNDVILWRVHQPSSVTVGASKDESQSGEQVTVGASIRLDQEVGRAPAGTVVFSEDGVAFASVALTNGGGEVRVAFTHPGYHTISADYSGDAYVSPSSGSALHGVTQFVPPDRGPAAPATSAAPAVPVTTTTPAPAAVPKPPPSPKPDARVVAATKAASAYLRAIAKQRWLTVCEALTHSARRELISLARVDGHRTTRCTTAARLELPPALGRFPVVSGSRIGRDVDVVIGDAAISDSGNDAIRMRLERGRWRVLDP